MHLTCDKITIANQFQDCYELVQSSIGQSILLTTNQIYIPKNRQINEDFAKVVEQFVSRIECIDFADPVASAETINQSIANSTNEQIRDLIQPTMLNSKAQIVSVNAVYFKGIWKYQFQKDYTIKIDFYMSKRKKMLAEFMHITERFNYAVLDDLEATALEMKYANSNFSFVIILPNSRSGLSKLEKKLKNYDLAQIGDYFHSREVYVKIPKFKAEFEINLKKVLQNVCSLQYNIV